MEFFKGIGFVVVLMAIGYWLTGRKWIEGEIQRNDQSEPPSDRQLRWDIRHMREDLHMLVLINYALLFLVLIFVFSNFGKPYLKLVRPTRQRCARS
jgi:hypothetical protein